MPKTNLRHNVFIDALPSKVWKVLTTPDHILQWMNGSFDKELREKNEICFFDESSRSFPGKVMEVVPGVVLKYELFESGNTTQYCFQLIPASEGIELQLYCNGFSDEEEQYLLRCENWKMRLQKLKWLSEFS